MAAAEMKTGIGGGVKVARPPGTPATATGNGVARPLGAPATGNGVTSAAGQAFQKAKAHALSGQTKK